MSIFKHRLPKYIKVKIKHKYHSQMIKQVQVKREKKSINQDQKRGNSYQQMKDQNYIYRHRKYIILAFLTSFQMTLIGNSNYSTNYKQMKVKTKELLKKTEIEAKEQSRTYRQTKIITLMSDMSDRRNQRNIGIQDRTESQFKRRLIKMLDFFIIRAELFLQLNQINYNSIHFKRVAMRKEPVSSKAHFLLIFYLVFLTFSKKETDQKLNALQILGFESWQQPTEQQIREQYKKLTNLYKQSENQDEKNQYKEIVDAFQQLKRNKFKILQQKSGFQNKFRQSDQVKGERLSSSGSYSYSHTYRPTYGFQEMELNLDFQDLIKDIDFDFLKLDPHQNSHFSKKFQSEEVKLNISAKDFFIWLLKNPLILIAAALISFGFFNLCTCCCCCCCSKCCRKNKGSNIKIKQVNLDRKKRKQNYKKMDQVLQQGYHSS